MPALSGHTRQFPLAGLPAGAADCDQANLTIHNITPQAAGTYRCEVVTTYLSLSNCYTLALLHNVPFLKEGFC